MSVTEDGSEDRCEGCGDSIPYAAKDRGASITETGVLCPDCAAVDDMEGVLVCRGCMATFLDTEAGRRSRDAHECQPPEAREGDR